MKVLRSEWGQRAWPLLLTSMGWLEAQLQRQGVLGGPKSRNQPERRKGWEVRKEGLTRGPAGRGTRSSKITVGRRFLSDADGGCSQGGFVYPWRSPLALHLILI